MTWGWNMIPSFWLHKFTKLHDMGCQESLCDWSGSTASGKSIARCTISRQRIISAIFFEGTTQRICIFSHGLWNRWMMWNSLKVTSSKTMQRARRQENLWQWTRISLRSEWFPRICCNHGNYVWPLKIYFVGATLKNEYSAANHAQMTFWNKALQIKSGRFTPWYWEALPTTRNAVSRCAWQKTVATSGTLSGVNLLHVKPGMCPWLLSHFVNVFMIYS